MSGARLPSRPMLLEVLVLEHLTCREVNGALPDVVVFFRFFGERDRLVWGPSTEGFQVAADVYTLCGKRQGEVRGIYEDIPPSFVSTFTSNVSVEVP